jgi:acetolactate synthase I/II/III large subunit
MKIAVSELIVRFMQRLGIGHVFGMPGAHILPVYDRLYDSAIKSVLVKHEQGAAFMAGGYARAAGRIGACITTAGPGAINLATGIANAYADKLPILIVTGETSTYIFGKGGLQESSGEGGSVAQSELFRSITRYHKIVERTDYLGQVLNQGASILLGPRPGPVLLSFPYNVQKELIDEAVLDDINFTSAPLPCRPPVDDLIRLIAAARAPVIVAGHGCMNAGAQRALGELAEQFGIPVATSLKAKGVVAEDSPLALGSLGVTSNGQAYRYLVGHADLIIFLGAGFNERTSYLWDPRLLAGKKIAQVDHDAGQLGKVLKADLTIHGDINAVVTDVLAALRHSGATRKPLDHPTGQTRASSDDAVAPHRFPLIESFFARLAERFPTDALVFDDNIIFAQNFFKVSAGNRYFANSGISSLGHAVPAAIGARCAMSGPTFAILGDGGFQMCCMELMTAVNYAIPINVVLINNGSMGLIRKNQFQLYGQRFIDCDFTNPDYRLLAQSFGIAHYKIDTEADIAHLLSAADLTGSINLIEIPLDKNAFPDYLADR